MSKFTVGAGSWKYTDGKQYGLPLDWAAAAFYYNEAMIKAAGLTEADMRDMTWNPTDGGTFAKIVAKLTVDKNGVRGDQAGFDPKHIRTYGVGSLGSGDFNGQASWNMFASSLGWKMGNKDAWPTKLNFDDPKFTSTVKFAKSLSDTGYAPDFGQFTTSTDQQIGSGSVAMVEDGSWVVPTFNQQDPGRQDRHRPAHQRPRWSLGDLELQREQHLCRHQEPWTRRGRGSPTWAPLTASRSPVRTGPSCPLSRPR